MYDVHRDVLARRKEGVVGVCAGDNGTKHHRLVGLVLEVGVPESVKLRTHLLELFGGGPDLPASVDEVGGQARLFGAGLPLGVELLLDLCDAAQEVVGGDGLVRDAEDL